ncbi:subtilisin-like protein [Sistotremastrum suecicum HHB10207 ss-3]|uniref:tripeptidyl-peptidase II n=1 Tax=Sistotremastrum suecicum HHB10207 ss-3 TaxID=1314776 RepID=A0A165YYZ4_9AGAM|nr:subtilisin-like protein [Sistotremastrum suecicum HHB10207 ss-3]
MDHTLACFLLLLYLTFCASASPRSTSRKFHSYSTKEEVNSPPGWHPVGQAPPEHVLQMRIYLVQPDFSVLEQALYQVSDPRHQKYGRHLSKRQVDALVAPAPESVETLDDWLSSHGFNTSSLPRSSAGDWISISIPVFKAEEMLRTTYYIWEYEVNNATLIRTTSYSLPSNLHPHVDVIQPTTSFASTTRQGSTLRVEVIPASSPPIDRPPLYTQSGLEVLPSCNTSINILCLKQIYNAVGYQASEKSGNKIGITGYLNELPSPEDLKEAFVAQNLSTANATYNFVSLNESAIFSAAEGVVASILAALEAGSNQAAQTGIEANLDVQYAFGLANPAPATFWATAGSPPFIPDTEFPSNSNEPYADWLAFILEQEDIPQVISTSYGDNEQTVPLSYATRVCNSFAQLGARGVSVIFSSGDGGVGDGISDPTEQKCFTNDGTNTTRFMPGFPATCPFVTAVGGTVQIPEVAASLSGGGLSDYFSRPSYQDSVVSAYLAALPPGTYDGLFNSTGRAIPDVAAQAVNYEVVYQGSTIGVSGTSAASPAFAGIISLVNDARLSKGMSSLGFLNPLIYASPSAFNDIISGHNPGCGTPGFNASVGWDPVTGLGTPDLQKLQSAFA